MINKNKFELISKLSSLGGTAQVNVLRKVATAPSNYCFVNKNSHANSNSNANSKSNDNLVSMPPDSSTATTTSTAVLDQTPHIIPYHNGIFAQNSIKLAMRKYEKPLIATTPSSNNNNNNSSSLSDINNNTNTSCIKQEDVDEEEEGEEERHTMATAPLTLTSSSCHSDRSLVKLNCLVFYDHESAPLSTPLPLPPSQNIQIVEKLDEEEKEDEIKKYISTCQIDIKPPFSTSLQKVNINIKPLQQETKLEEKEEEDEVKSSLTSITTTQATTNPNNINIETGTETTGRAIALTSVTLATNSSLLSLRTSVGLIVARS